MFHSRTAVTRKAWSPMVERRVRRTTSDNIDAEWICWRASSADDWWNSSARYGGAVWCKHLYTRTANSIHSGTFSQCSCVRSGVLMSYVNAENTSRGYRHCWPNLCSREDWLMLELLSSNDRCCLLDTAEHMQSTDLSTDLPGSVRTDGWESQFC